MKSPKQKEEEGRRGFLVGVGGVDAAVEWKIERKNH